MYEEILEEIGLSKNEAKIYVCLLNSGPSAVTAIAKECQIHRANAYDSVKKLMEKGLVTHVKKENTTLYSSLNPNSLLRIVQEKEEMVKKIIPQLMLSRELAGKESEARIVEGIEGFMNLIYGLLDYNKEILTYGIPVDVPDMIKTKIPHFHKKRIDKKIKIRHIYNHDARERIDYLNKMPFTEARCLPASFDSPVDTTICGEEIIITHWIKPVVSVQIKNEKMADSYRKYFELLWEASR